ncbi:MAG: hypothetical protein CMJ87_04075 [Planctomycetes bacterium]|nr:hypothetical protein [Planctomycetota bacterium]
MGSLKVSRNSPCPCGSGRKYKKCHLGREFDLPIELERLSGISDPHVQRELSLAKARPGELKPSRRS